MLYFLMISALSGHTNVAYPPITDVQACFGRVFSRQVIQTLGADIKIVSPNMQRMN